VVFQFYDIHTVTIFVYALHFILIISNVSGSVAFVYLYVLMWKQTVSVAPSLHSEQSRQNSSIFKRCFGDIHL
jgi:hypothetical protein